MEEGYGESRVWTGLPLGRFAAWTVERDTAPTPTHMYALSHTPTHTALLGGLCQARGHCRMSQNCCCSLRGWSDVFVLPGCLSDVRCRLVLKFFVAFVLLFGWGLGGCLCFVRHQCASSWTTWECQHHVCGSRRKLTACLCRRSVTVGHGCARGSGEVRGCQGREADFPLGTGGEKAGVFSGGQRAMECSG